MEEPQKCDWLKGFMDHLRGLTEEPPYSAIFFVSAIFLIISLFSQNHFNIFIVIFLYSIFGAIWRHATKDIRGRLKEAYPNNFTKCNLLITSVYQFINLVVVFVLFFVIVRFCI